MSIDYKWQSNGGLLLDGTGDIASTQSPMETAIDMVRTRLKATLKAWKLYQIGAGLDTFIGNSSSAEAETAIQRQVLGALSKNYLPSGTFDVRTLRLGGTIQVYVYISDKLIAQAEVPLQAGT